MRPFCRLELEQQVSSNNKLFFLLHCYYNSSVIKNIWKFNNNNISISTLNYRNSLSKHRLFYSLVPEKSLSSPILSLEVSLCQVIWPQSVQVSYQIFQANKQLFERLILISQSAAKKSLASGQQRAEKKGKGSDFTAGIFVCLHIQSFSALFCRVGLTNMFTSSPSSSHVPKICPTHMHSIYTERFGGFFVSKHLPSVVCVVSEHGPLSACWRCSSVWRRRCPSRKPPAASRDPQQPGWAEEETEKEDTWDTGLLLTNLDWFWNFGTKAVMFKRDLLCTAKVLNNAVRLCVTPHLQFFLWPCISTDAPATFFLQRAANQKKAG